MKRYLVALGAASLVGTVVLGSAAALNVDGGVAQAGIDNNLTCDDAVKVIQRHEFDNTTEPFSIGPQVQDVSAECEDQWVIVTAFDGAGNQLGQSTQQVPTGGGLVNGHWDSGDLPISDIYQMTVGLVS